MTEIKYYCDGCKKEVSNANCLNNIELPRIREDFITIHKGLMMQKSCKVGLKHYDFCEDCWKKIGIFMSVFDNNGWTFDELTDGVLKVAKDMLERENDNVN